MDVFLVALLLLAGVALLTPVADRFGVPGPVALTGFGVALALVPGIPDILLPSELVLPMVLPPLLYAASYRSSARDFRANARQLVSLAVVLVLVTTATVAFAARAAQPALPVAAAIALGAIVSPPDPIAATSLAGQLRLPRRLVAVLEGEGLLNDALALVVYTVAVAAATTGSLSAWDTGRILLTSVVVGPLVGLACGWVGSRVLDLLEDPRAEVALTLLVPYGAYLTVDALGGSGVLAVVVAGLYVGQHGVNAFSSSGFLAGTAVWAVSDWVVTGLTFGLIGFELTTVLGEPDLPTSGGMVAVVVCIAVVVTRGLYILPLSWLEGRRMRASADRAGGEPADPAGWREATVTAWAGMRGVVTLATALALPSDFPGRSTVVFAAIAVVLVTLVGQGLTLPWVVRALHVQSGEDHRVELKRTRERVVRAALAQLDEMESAGEVDEPVADYLRRAYERMLPPRTAARAAARGRMQQERAAAKVLRETERTMVHSLRAEGRIDGDTASALLSDIEYREVRDVRRRPLASPPVA